MKDISVSLVEVNVEAKTRMSEKESFISKSPYFYAIVVRKAKNNKITINNLIN